MNTTTSTTGSGGRAVLVWIFLTIALVLTVVNCRHKYTVAKQAAKEFARTNRPPAAPETVEALVLVQECYTPCSSFVGWDYKIRTDGHPLLITGEWGKWELPSEGDVKAPKTFKAGEASLESPDTLHPNIRVQMYKKVKIQQ